MKKETQLSVLKEIRDLLREQVKQATLPPVQDNQFLTLLSGKETLTLDKCNGSQIIPTAKKVFSWIDPDFRSYGADDKGKATPETPVSVYEMKQDATFEQLFTSLSSDVDSLCLTQHQVLRVK